MIGLISAFVCLTVIWIVGSYIIHLINPPENEEERKVKWYRRKI